MAAVEETEPYRTFENGQVRFYLTVDDRNQRIYSVRAVNDTDMYCYFIARYQGFRFPEAPDNLLAPRSERTWDIAARFGNIDRDAVQLSTGCSIDP